MTEVNAPRRRKATRPRRRMALVDATDEAPGGRTLPAIDAGQDLRTVTAAAWRALTAANDPPRLFGYGDLLVRVETHGREKAVTRVLTPDRLRHELARAADWQYDQWSPRGPVVPPDHVIRDMLADPRPPLPRLMQITAAPVFGPTGTLHTTPGYCAEAGSYYAPPPGFRPVTSKQVVNLKVDGITGRWEKMADGKDGRPTNGLKPNAGAKRAWHELLEHRGCEVDITWVGESIPPTIDSTPAVVKRPPVENSTASHEVQGLLSKDRTQPAFDAGREVSNLPAQVIHADWGIDPNKRWQARAFLQPNGRYLVEPAEPLDRLTIGGRRPAAASMLER